uniref:Structural polyprotein n=1 Tax=Rumple rubivirus TaxID=2937922 RepID=A0A9N7AAL9_9VIRU|nr:TPA_asm: ORF2 protein [Rumple rubivirus]
MGRGDKAPHSGSGKPRPPAGTYAAAAATPPAAVSQPQRGRDPRQAHYQVHPNQAGVVAGPLPGPAVTATDVAIDRGFRPPRQGDAGPLDGTCFTSWMWDEGKDGKVYRIESHVYAAGDYVADGQYWDRTIMYNPCDTTPPHLVRAATAPSDGAAGIWGKGHRTYVETTVRAANDDGGTTNWRRLSPYPTQGAPDTSADEDGPAGVMERPAAKRGAPWRYRFKAPAVFTLGMVFWLLAQVASAENAPLLINGTEYNSSSVLPGTWRMGTWGCATWGLPSSSAGHTHVCHKGHRDIWCTPSTPWDTNCTAAHAKHCVRANYTCGPMRPGHRADRRCGRSICGPHAIIPAPASVFDCTFALALPPWQLCARTLAPPDGWTCHGAVSHPGDCCSTFHSPMGVATCAPFAWAASRTGAGWVPDASMSAMFLLMPWMLLYMVCTRFRRKRAALAAAVYMLPFHASRTQAEEASASLCSRPGCSTILVSPLTITSVTITSQPVDGGCFTPWDLEATGCCVCDVPTDASCAGLAPHVPERACARIANGSQVTCNLWVINPFSAGGSAQLGSYFVADGAAYKAYHPTSCKVQAAFEHTSDACWGFSTDTVESVFVEASYVHHAAKTVNVVFHREVVTVYGLTFAGVAYNVTSRDPQLHTPQGVLAFELPPPPDELTEYKFNLSGHVVSRWGSSSPNCHGPDWASPVCASHSPDCTRAVGQPPEVPTLTLFDDADASWEGAPPPGHVWARPVRGRQARKCSLDLKVGPYGHASLEMPEWLNAHLTPDPHLPPAPLRVRLQTPRPSRTTGTATPMGVRVVGCYSCGTPARITGAIRGPGACALTIGGQPVGGLPPGTFDIYALISGPPPYGASCGGASVPTSAAVRSPGDQSFVGVLYGTHTETVHETAQSWYEWARGHWWQILLTVVGGLIALLVLARAARCLYHLRGAFAPPTKTA